MKRTSKIIGTFVTLILMTFLLQQYPYQGSPFLTLLPPLIAIVFAFITKNVVVSLFLGGIFGELLSQINLGTTGIMLFINTFYGYVIRCINTIGEDAWNAGVVMQILLISGLIMLITKMKGTHAVAAKLAKRANSSKTAQFLSWILGILIFFEDYASALIVGPVMKGISDYFNVSREKFAFIVDAMAAPVASIALIATWLGTELGSIRAGFDQIGMEVNPYAIFVEALPFRFYNLFLILFIPMTIFMAREWGLMLVKEKEARKRVVTNEKLDFKEFDGKVSNALIPLGVLVFGSIFGFIYQGYYALSPETLASIGSVWSIDGIKEIIGAANAAVVLSQNAFLAIVVSLIMIYKQKMFTISESCDYIFEGMSKVLFTVFILIFAWGLSGIMKEIGTSAYLASLLGDNIPGWALPSIVFMFACFISFSTGTSYGTMKILMPLVVPLAYSVTHNATIINSNMIIIGSIAAVMSGACFGDHCSPISDTTALSCVGTECEHMSHVNTQLPYGLLILMISIVSGYLLIGFGVSPYISLFIGIVSLLLIVRFIFKKVE